MRETSPSVHLISRPRVDLDSVRAYLEAVGGTSWLEMRAEAAERGSDAELLIEFAGRVCYRSWEPGLNPNVSRIRTDQGEYFMNLLQSGHGSVLEHANFTFVFHHVSRVFTHELVRHRAGSAFSQESLRYVRLTDIGFRVPPALEGVRAEVVEMVERLEEFQRNSADALLDDEMPFAVKKEVTSALRRLAPLGLSTDIVWTANTAPRDCPADGSGCRGGDAPGLRPGRRAGGRRGAGAVSGLQPPRGRQLGADPSQGLTATARGNRGYTFFASITKSQRLAAAEMDPAENMAAAP